MTRISSNWATVVPAIVAFVFTIGFAASAAPADARPVFAKYDGVDGESATSAKPGRTIKRAEGKICCYLPREGKVGIVKPSDCRKLKGRLAPQNKCAQAGAKASDAYFVKVDSETTTQNSKPAAPARIRSAAGKVCCSVPRRGRLALIKPSDCRAVKGKVVPKKRCGRTEPVSATKFGNLTLKRGLISRDGASSKPGGPSSVKAGKGQMSIYCANGNQYFPCWCEGAGSCNNFIAACVEVGGDLNCNEHNGDGQPTACSCYK